MMPATTTPSTSAAVATAVEAALFALLDAVDDVCAIVRDVFERVVDGLTHLMTPASAATADASLATIIVDEPMATTATPTTVVAEATIPAANAAATLPAASAPASHQASPCASPAAAASTDEPTSALAPRANKPCVVCGDPTPSRCKRCVIVPICSQVCFLAVWPSHKVDCPRLQETRRIVLAGHTSADAAANVSPASTSVPASPAVPASSAAPAAAVAPATTTTDQKDSSPLEDGPVPLVRWLTVTTVVKSAQGATADVLVGSHTVVLLTTTLGGATTEQKADMSDARDILDDFGVVYHEMDAWKVPKDDWSRFTAVSNVTGVFPQLFLIKETATPATPTVLSYRFGPTAQIAATTFTIDHLSRMRHFQKCALRPPSRAVIVAKRALTALFCHVRVVDTYLRDAAVGAVARFAQLLPRTTTTTTTADVSPAIDGMDEDSVVSSTSAIEADVTICAACDAAAPVMAATTTPTVATPVSDQESECAAPTTLTTTTTASATTATTSKPPAREKRACMGCRDMTEGRCKGCLYMAICSRQCMTKVGRAHRVDCHRIRELRRAHQASLTKPTLA